MSNYFTGVTFAEQAVTPSDDAVLRRTILPDGVLTGCAFSYSGSTLTMAAGALLICGRQVRHTAVQNWPVVDAASGYARLVLTVDLSRTSTRDAFDQVNDSIEYASSLEGFAALDQADINGAGTRYQIEACAISLGTGGITGIVRKMSDHSSAGVYAPAGYGLGQEAAASVSSLAELDGLTKSGWYQLNVPSNAAVVNGCNVSKATVFVKAFDTANTQQTVTPIGSTSRLIRSRTGGTWDSWGFENPPMELGTEYKTTEFWGGAPVYVKRIAFTAGSFTTQNIAFPHGIENMGICFDVKVLWKRTDKELDGWRLLPSSEYSTGEWDGQVEYVNSDSVKFRLGSELQYRIKLSTEPVYVTLKYTKL